MKNIKLLLAIMLVFSAIQVKAQYTEKWASNLDFQSSNGISYLIGIENMDNDGNKEIVYFNTGGNNNPYFIILDSNTGVVKFTLNCSSVKYSYSMPVLADVNNDGKYELIFIGTITSTDINKLHMISFTNPSGVSQTLSNDKMNIENYPNPFNESTKIKFNVPNTSQVTVNLYDNKGTMIKTLLNEQRSMGEYEIALNGSDLTSGVYYYQVQMNNLKDAKKMIVIK